jgi:hypothetical protein
MTAPDPMRCGCGHTFDGAQAGAYGCANCCGDQGPARRSDRTAAARQQRLRARGAQVSAVLTDPVAVSVLRALCARHGGQRAALTALLLALPPGPVAVPPPAAPAASATKTPGKRRAARHR